MKKFILFICLLWSVAAMAQEPPYTPMRSNYKFRGVRIDSLFMPPAFTDTSIANAIGLNTIEGNVIRVDSIVYVRFNNRWRKQGNGAGTTIDTTSLSARIDARVKYTDTASMLSPYLRKIDTASLSGRIDARIKYTDSAAMLTPYLRKIDTASLSNRINEKIENIIRSSDSVYFYKNGVKTFAYKDSLGATNGFVPYTGATQDVDLGNNGLNAKNIKITGTAGNGHIDLKHQSGDATGQANSTKLYANSSGYLKWKNDNLYYSTLAMPQTADRVYTYQNKSYTLGDSADIAERVKYTDTSSMLSPYFKKSDSTLYQTSYRSDTMRTNIYSTLNGKLNTSDSSLYQTKFRTDTMRTNIWNQFLNEVNLGDSNTVYSTKFRVDTMRTNVYNQLLNRVRYSDTASMLSNYSRSINVVKYADTAAMLTNYQRNSSFPVATFGAGSGTAGDTSAFSTTALYGSFYNAGGDTIILTSYTAAVQGTSASITPTIWFNDSLNVTAGGTKIVNSPAAVTSTTTGNTVTSLDNTKIPPGNFVWVSSGTVTTKPTFFTLTLIGYRKR